MNKFISGFIIILLALLFTGCENKGSSEGYSEELIKVPPSFLSIDVNLPISEVEELLQNNMKVELLKEKPVVLNERKGDSLYISLKRYGKLDMAYNSGKLYMSMPIEVEAVISKKVLGIRLKNDNSPVEFKAIASISSDVSIDENWELILDCHWKEIKWVKKPIFSLLGFSFDLTEIIEEQINANSGELEMIICGLVNEKVKFSNTAAKIFHDIQKPNRIIKNPFELYLHATPSDFKGELNTSKRDTISMHVELRSLINIGTEQTKAESLFMKLPTRSRPLNQNNALSAFVEMQLSHVDLKTVLNTILAGRKFTYKEYDLMVNVEEILSESGRLKVIFSVSGDINGNLSLTGYPTITDDLNISFSSFEYDLINVEEDWVSITDFTVHEALEKYLEGILQVDAFGFFEKVDVKAMKGIRKSRLGEKLDITLDFDAITPYQLRVTPEVTQLILEVDGRAYIDLTREVLKKKK